MGWKNIKEYFGIKHIVHGHDGKIFIGSAYCSKLIIIDNETGNIDKNSFSNIGEQYPELLKLLTAHKETILILIKENDKFSASLPVFTFDGQNIIEKQCEAYGWPNVTHDGELMYDNTFFKKRLKAIEYGIKDTEIGIRNFRDRIADYEQELIKSKKLLDAEIVIFNRLSELIKEERA